MLEAPIGAFTRSPLQNLIGTRLRASYELLLGALVELPLAARRASIKSLGAPLRAPWELPLAPVRVPTRSCLRGC